MRSKIELLSPAGDLERLKIALIYGADAVYIGGKDYSLRANANNFSIDEIKEACTFAHNLGKKVYLTLNIVFQRNRVKIKQGNQFIIVFSNTCNKDCLIILGIICHLIYLVCRQCHNLSHFVNQNSEAALLFEF